MKNIKIIFDKPYLVVALSMILEFLINSTTHVPIAGNFGSVIFFKAYGFTF